MSTFKFNFSSEDENQDGNSNAETCDETISWLECEEIIPDKTIQDINDLVTHASIFICGDVEISYVRASEALAIMCKGENVLTSAAELAEKEHSDLVTGKYEGGLKIWEGTNDLIGYFESQSEIQFQDKKALDLGCGAGILGIYAFLKQSSVTFQDYNKEILDCVTIPNLILNIEDNEEETMDLNECKFYSGDWASFNRKLPDTEQFDIILTSETIYNTNNYDKLIDLFIKRLSPNGEVYVAAKTCYFGVGGGTRQFESSLKKNGLFDSTVCWKSSGGILREILKITRKT